MTTRILKYNASPVRELWRWKVQVKRSGRWLDYRVNGAVKSFENEWWAENYRRMIEVKRWRIITKKIT
jgi:hypothetical protein